MVASSDVYAGINTSTRINSKIYKLDSCLVIPPPTPNFSKPRAIIKFLGGAFIGAIPQVTYGYLIESLAKEGFLVVVVPYDVTFNHFEAVKQVYERFQKCLDNILTYGFPQANLSPAQLSNPPLFSVGHSVVLQLGPAVSQMMPIVEANPVYSIDTNAPGDTGSFGVQANTT